MYDLAYIPTKDTSEHPIRDIIEIGSFIEKCGVPYDGRHEWWHDVRGPYHGGNGRHEWARRAGPDDGEHVLELLGKELL